MDTNSRKRSSRPVETMEYLQTVVRRTIVAAGKRVGDADARSPGRRDRSSDRRSAQRAGQAQLGADRRSARHHPPGGFPEVGALIMLADRIAAAGIAHPINWDEMGSSAKDAWEERMIRSIERSERRAAALAELNRTAEQI
jgi:hypothetical protein